MSSQKAKSSEGQRLLEEISQCLVVSEEAQWTEDRFNRLALKVFRFQWSNNRLYRRWCEALTWTPARVEAVTRWTDIPTLPVEAFKWGEVRTEGVEEREGEPLVFRTSGTTGSSPGVHTVRTPALYDKASAAGFRREFGSAEAGRAELLALLPGYLERPDSSLVHMVRGLRQQGWKAPESTVDDGFFLDDVHGLFRAVDRSLERGRRPVVLGVTWAMVDAADAWLASGRPPMGDRVIVVETGGMKGRRKEWVREAVHEHLTAGFGCACVGGEYGMTELLSQAWSQSGGLYQPPPWMRVRLRRTDDPLSPKASMGTGGVDIVDLANVGSCSFLSTQDLGKFASLDEDAGAFEILGRFDHAEVRGCNLMVH